MAKTPYVKLASQDILSAHVSGLGSAINNIETALNMRTETINNVQLTAVSDNEDSSERYRIYEGSKRCWLASPTPTIKRNGVVVSSNEYVIQSAYGVVVFHKQQKSSDVITVSATIISSESTALDTINYDITSIKNDVKDLKNSSGSNSGNTGTSTGGAISGVYGNSILSKQAWISNYLGGSGMPTATYTTSAGVWDLVPIIITEDMSFDKMRVYCVSSSSNPNIVLSLYSNRDDLGYPYPNKLLAKTDVMYFYSTSSPGWLEGSLKECDSSGNRLQVGIKVKAGIYWLGKIATNEFKSKGFDIDLDADRLISIVPPNGKFAASTSYNTFTDGQVSYAIKAVSAWSNGTPVTFPTPTANSIGFYNSGLTNMFIRKSN